MRRSRRQIENVPKHLSLVVGDADSVGGAGMPDGSVDSVGGIGVPGSVHGLVKAGWGALWAPTIV